MRGEVIERLETLVMCVCLRNTRTFNLKVKVHETLCLFVDMIYCKKDFRCIVLGDNISST